jgi:hypothetical protein
MSAGATRTRIDELMPAWDAAERHAATLPYPAAEVWAALQRTDFGRPLGVRVLMGLRALPALAREPRRWRERPKRSRLGDLERVGFGRLVEEPGREVVLGVQGRFWRLAGNIEPFSAGAFAGPVPSGLARGVWSFRVEPVGEGAARLETETRVLCGDPASRRKFRRYWLLVRPGSGLIRRWILAEVRREARRGAAGSAG